MEHVARLFGEAWERQHRRHRTFAWAAAMVCAGAILSYAVLGPRPPAAPPADFPTPPGTVVEAPSVVFSQPPYMGVRCPVPNSIACDRVGLALWLKRPAYSVTASINGRLLAMNRFGDHLVSAARPRTEFDGYLRPAGIVTTMHVRAVPGTTTWLGDSTPFAVVWVLISYGRGRDVTTHLQVPLMAGWG
jgi:hypothetical protein